MKKGGEAVLYVVVLLFATFGQWLRKQSNNFAIALGMLVVVCGGFYGAQQMKAEGERHQIDATYLEEQYMTKKRDFAKNCLKEGRGFAAKGEQMNPEVIEACENMATAMYPSKDFSKVAMLNWERQQLGIVIYEEDPMNEQ
jgi:hypothetical protein